jgi:biopolymer transport protein ExbD
MKINLDNNGDNAPRVEVVPLIDVIFCILTVFLLSGLQAVQRQVISIDVPQADTKQEQTRQSMMVTLGADGIAYVQQSLSSPLVSVAYNEDQTRIISQEVAAYKAANPNGSVLLAASKELKYDRVANIFNSMRLAGGGIVSLAIDPVETILPQPSTVPALPTTAITPSPTVTPIPTVNPTR